VAFLVSVLVIVGDIFILVFETTPAVEVVPEVVEVLDFFFGAFFVA
jgi:hypothetical protein